MGLNSNGQREATSLRNDEAMTSADVVLLETELFKITLMRTIGSRLILMEMVNLAWILVVMFWRNQVILRLLMRTCHAFASASR